MKAARGMTLIEAVVGTAIMLIVFLGIFAAFQISLDLVFSTRAATSATALVNERMEYIRGLTYDAVGTSGGIPAGPIPQVEQVSLNGIPYTLSTLVQYVDDPTDGLDELDETGVTADYKLIRVSAHWVIRGLPRTTYALTKIAPTGIETLTAGGTLRVNVFDVAAAPVSGAEVHIVNSAVNPAVDVTVTTGASGAIAFPGAPPGAGYQVTVSKEGYSSAQTYAVTTENQNPNPGHLSIVNQTTTTLSLSIDRTGSLKLYTFAPVGPGEFEDLFSNDLKLSATSSVAVTGGVLQLADDAGVYAAVGNAYSLPVAPQYLASWDSVSWNAATPAGTSALVSVYYWNGATHILVPDADLPGNSTGFSGGSISLATLPVATYGQLQLRADLLGDTTATSEIQDWIITYNAGPTPLPDVDFDIHGAKTIGVSSQGAALYKYDDSLSTTQYGEWIITPIEADSYSISLPQSSPYTISELCPVAPSVAPGSDIEVTMSVVDAAANSLRVVATGSGQPISGAAVSVVGDAVNESLNTSACGQTFFGDIPANAYTVTITAPGYQNAVETVSVAGDIVLSVVLIPL